MIPIGKKRLNFKFLKDPHCGGRIPHHNHNGHHVQNSHSHHHNNTNSNNHKLKRPHVKSENNETKQSEQLYLAHSRKRNLNLDATKSPLILPNEIKELLTNHSVVPYFDGNQIWVDMWDSIANAKDQIFMSTFIIEDDVIGQRTIHELSEAAKRGCKVIFIYDYFGSFMINTNLFSELKKNGGVVIEFQNIRKLMFKNLVSFSPLSLRRVSFIQSLFYGTFSRVHQKVLVIDEKVGFCGGLNIGKDYAAPGVGGTGRFTDIHCKITGPAVKSLEDTFFETLKLSSDDWDVTAANALPKIVSNRKRPLVYLRWYKEKMKARFERAKHFRNSVRTKLKLNHSTMRTSLGSVNTKFFQMNTYFKNRRLRKKERNFMEMFNKFSSSVNNKKDYFTEKRKKFQSYPFQIYEKSRALTHAKMRNSTSTIVQILDSYNNKERKKFEIQKAYLSAIKNAKNSIRISTPYFMPPPPVCKLLEEAVSRGVDVQILTQGKSDRPIMFWAAQHAYYQFIKKGVRIHEMLDSELHAKTIEIDGYYASIGSDNLDHISWAYNSEAKVVIFDQYVAQKMRDNFKQNVDKSREVNLTYMDSRSFHLTFMSFVAYKCYHLVYPWKNWQIE